MQATTPPPPPAPATGATAGALATVAPPPPMPIGATPSPRRPARQDPSTRSARAGTNRRSSGHTPAVLGALGALMSVAIATSAVVAAVTTTARTSRLDRLAATASVSTAAGDAAAAFAATDAAAAALTLPGATAADELRFEQALATGVNALTATAALTTEGDAVESRARRALRTVGPYTATVEQAAQSARAGRDPAAASAQATAYVENLMRGNAEQVRDIQDRAVRDRGAALTGNRAGRTLLELLPFVAAVALLVAAQLFVTRRFRRLLNLPMLLATVVVAGVAVRSIRLQDQAATRAASLLSGPYEQVRLLTQARVAAFGARSAETIQILGAAANDEPARRAAMDGSILGAVDEVSRNTASAGFADPAGTMRAASADANAITAAQQRYEAVHPTATDITDARRAAEATRQPGSSASRFAVLDAELLRARNAAQARVDAAVAEARRGQSTNAWLAPGLLLVALALAWFGLQRRLAEYR